MQHRSHSATREESLSSPRALSQRHLTRGVVHCSDRFPTADCACHIVPLLRALVRATNDFARIESRCSPIVVHQTFTNLSIAATPVSRGS